MDLPACTAKLQVQNKLRFRKKSTKTKKQNKKKKFKNTLGDETGDLLNDMNKIVGSTSKQTNTLRP